MNRNSTNVTPPFAGDGQTLEIQKVYPKYNAATEWTFTGGAQSTVYLTGYVYIAAQGLASGTGVSLIMLRNASYSVIGDVALYSNGSNPVFEFVLYNNGAKAYYYSGAVSLNTWYRIDVKYDVTNLAWEWRVNGVSQNRGILTGTLYSPPTVIRLGMTLIIIRFPGILVK